MKYVLTGGAGHISGPLAEKLIQAGHQVTVIGRDAGRLTPLAELGASIAEGSVEDEAFVTAAFSGADAVYLMIPPNFSPENGWRQYQNKVADIYCSALKANRIQYAVVLSSVGAHMGEGAGPVDGLADLEKKLAGVEGLHARFLRPSYFYYNFFSFFPLIKGMNIMGSNFGNTEEKLVLTDTRDIAEAAFEELVSLNFRGHSVRYIASDERHPDEIAGVLSREIGKPGIPWVSFTDEQALGGMLQAGLPQTLADGYVALGRAIREGAAQEDYWAHRPASLGKVKLEDFAKQFAAAFAASS